MIIESILIRNFRSILDETLHCEQLTALVGANGTGKSSFLKAIDLFYSPSPRIDPEDYYDKDTSREIVIAIKFNNLSEDAKDLFASYMQGETLTVERVFPWLGGKFSSNYHGSSLQNEDFAPIRTVTGAKEKRGTYDELRKTPEYSDLPQWKNLNDAMNSLKDWESSNQGKCVRQRDDGQFFGFKEVAKGYLGRFTRFLFIPAVRDASEDAAEGRGSVLTGLMDLVVRSVLANKEEVKKLKEETQKQYEELMNPSKLEELNTLGMHLTDTLKTFAPDAMVDLSWLPLEDVNIPMPKADIKLIEDGYSAAVSRTGHGLQRAFVLTMLQHLAVASHKADWGEPIDKSEKEKTGLPNLILAIEEPELYQHPNRQRHLAKIFMQLASGTTPGVAESTQIIYGTHSPLFVGIDRIDQIRLLRKIIGPPDKPKITKIVRTTLDEIAEIVWKADGEPGTQYTGATLSPRLQAIMTPWMSEGFFADVVVLVEGEDDRAAILGTAKALGHDMESMGFSIIPCGGKTNLDRPAAILRQLGIPVYLIWDGDQGEDAKPGDNHRLLRLMGQGVQDWPCQVHDNYACFAKNMETTLRDEIGPGDFDAWLDECKDDLCIPKKKHALKNPWIVSAIIKKAQEQGKRSRTFDNIIKRIISLKSI
jgi:putative ATP-dependent endonuclease of the OLD family